MIPLDLTAKEDANYRAAKDLEKSCSKCQSFTPPKDCATVEGPVDPSFTCDKFMSEEDAGDVAEPDADEDDA